MITRLIPLAIVFPLLAACAATSKDAPADSSEWVIQGTWTDSCCCKVPCPCLFGSKPTEGYCEGASLLEVDSGHYGDVSLDGVSAVVTYRVGQWSKVFVADRARPEQVEALAAALPEALPFLQKAPPPVVATAPLVVRRSGNTITYSVPETTVELALLESASGEPIQLAGLPAKGAPFPEVGDHTQYKSRSMTHDSAGESFTYTERNGFASTLDLSSGQK